VTDFAGAPVHFNRPDPRAPGLMVAGKALHRGLTALRNG
jgi:hypothetical protein